MHRLAGKVAIVTGAGSGIGQGIAKCLGSEGAKVIVDYIGNPAGAQVTLSAIEQAGGQGDIVEADVTSMDDMHKLVDAAWNRFGTAGHPGEQRGHGEQCRFLGTTEGITTRSWP